MHPRSVIFVAVGLGLLGTAVPIAGAVYLSWQAAVADDTERLSQLADQAIDRTVFMFNQATQVLRTISASGYIPCSSDHIAEMRRLTMNARAVDEIGYFEAGKLRCTSWGPTTVDVALEPGTFRTKGDIEVTTDMSPRVTRGKRMMAVQLGSYNVLVDPMRMFDVIGDPEVKLAVAHESGNLVVADDDAGRTLFDQARRSSFSDDFIVAHAKHGEWQAAAALPRAQTRRHLWRELLFMLPIGAGMAAIIVGIVVYFSRKRLSPEGELALAVANREFVVQYQPILELKTGACTGAEALVRWRRPDGSMVRPDLFIPLAEETGLILPITDQVIANVIADLGAALIENRDLHIAINFAAVDMKTGRVLDVLQSALDGTGIEPQQIWLEATERGCLDLEPTVQTITRARALGHAVAIDDFGTGYSSLQYLAKLPLDALKIDKSFVDTIGKDTATSAVTLHIIEMAKALNLLIVAEGIETKEQLDYLVEHQVGFGQGWLFSKPVSALDFMDYFNRRKPRRTAVATLVHSAA